MHDVITKIKKIYPQLKFKQSDSSYWSPMTQEIYYAKDKSHDLELWSLLHEVGHALCDHKAYDADFTLIRLEIEAWDRARELGKQLDIAIDENHIEDCLDTYRDWLYKRSVCPQCSAKCFQQSDFKHYQCFNCHASWRVTPSRFCRSYRATEERDKLQYIFA